jgi:hypothetical protein
MDTHFTGYQAHDAFVARHLRGEENILSSYNVKGNSD